MFLSTNGKRLANLFISNFIVFSSLFAQSNTITFTPLKDVTINCGDAIPSTKPSSKTTCTKSGLINFEMKEISDGFCPMIITRTWTISDPCGNKASTTQKITVIDKSAPGILKMPENITTSCNSIPAPATILVKDKCDTDVKVAVKDVIYDVVCTGNYKIRRNYIASDRCGNSASRAQIITVIDDKAPVFTSKPASITVSCANIPAPIFPTASDNCTSSDKINVFFYDKIINMLCQNSYTIRRTWIAKDECGKATQLTQNIVVQDTEKPVFTSVPSNITVECSNLVPSTTNVSAVDNCDKNLSIYLKISKKAGSCANNFQLVKEWLAIDRCNNRTTAQQIITVNDAKKPVFAPNIKDITISCKDVVPSETPIVTDNCDKSIAINYQETSDTSACKSWIQRVWTATDVCGNKAQSNQRITIFDNEKPLFATIVSDVTVECGKVPALPNISVTDNCDTKPKVVFKENIVANGGDVASTCSNKIVRTWIATDKCGNSNSISQTLWFNDKIVPVFVKVPPSMTIECGQTPTNPKPVASDNCSDKINYTFEDFLQAKDPSMPCKSVYTRVWKATDLCGNFSTISQQVVLDDKTIPTPSMTPQNITISCGDTIPSKPNILFVDNCTKVVKIQYTEEKIDTFTSIPNGFFKIIRKWQAVDDCGNIRTLVQELSISNDDHTAPIIDTTNLTNKIILECSDLKSLALLYEPVFPKASDFCSEKVTVTYQDDDAAFICGENGKLIIRTWIAQDMSGNTSSFEQVLEVKDKTAPMIFGTPSDITLTCGSTVPALSQSIIAIDTCSLLNQQEEIVIDFSEVKYQGNCPDGFGKIKRFWKAIDACGNSTFKTQTITFVPNTNTKIKNDNGESEIQSVMPFLVKEDEKINVYPNPTTGKIHLSLPFRLDNLLIFNNLGQNMYSLKNIESGILTLDMCHWEDGVYVLKSQNANITQTQKIYLKK